MRQRLGIILTIVVAIGVLIAINSLAYVTEEEKQDSELSPNRSTYHAGPTGTRALYDLLNESGYKVTRWRETPDRLLRASENVQTFVVIGRSRVLFDEEDAKNLLLWVEQGGRLVVIDRRPEDLLLPRSGQWKVTSELIEFPAAIDPALPEQMTAGVKPVNPAQPSVLTRDVAEVMPSRYVSAIRLFSVDKTKKAEEAKAEAEEDFFGLEDEEPSPQDSGVVTIETSDSAAGVSPAPVVHLATSHGPLLIDYPHGKGRIAVLSDPFIVANNGIALRDNLRLALNLVAGYEGQIAFDEFHQGRGTAQNAFVRYFQGTPVLPIAGQLVLLILLILWTRGRRFARPLPLPRIDRRSSLEFVASMAELQQRARAFDLAIENVYSRTRRVLARYAGVDYNSSRKEIAERVAARSTIDAHQLETLMRQSEEAINGGYVSERQSIQLVKRLREVETQLGLRMRARQVKQTVQNI